MAVLAIGGLLGGALWVLRPFLPSLVWAATIVVSTWPLMTALQRHLGGRRGLAVAAMTVALLMLLLVPLSVVIATIASNAARIVSAVNALRTLELPLPPDWVAGVPLVGHMIDETWRQVSIDGRAALQDELAPYLAGALRFVAARAGGVGVTLVHFLLTVGVAGLLFSTGEEGALAVRRFFRRLAGPRGEAAVVLAANATRAVALGVVLTALAQTVLAGAGLLVAGIPHTGLLTALVLVLCIAQIGPGLVLIPTVIWLFTSDATGRGTFLLLWSVATLSVDNLLRPYLIKKGADLPLWLIFAGVIGGLLAFGIIGLFIGPVILAVTYTLVQSWVDELGPEPAPPAPEPPPEPPLPA